MRLGAAVGGRLPVPQGVASEDVVAKENGAVTVGGIAALKRELAMLKAKYAPYDATIAQLRKQVGAYIRVCPAGMPLPNGNRKSKSANRKTACAIKCSLTHVACGHESSGCINADVSLAG